MVQVREILAFLNVFAPFELAEEWDNVGLLIGGESSRVSKVLTCLDVTPKVINQAVDFGANLIISHHPVIFKPLSQIDSDSIPYLIAKNGLNYIAVHTNLDKATGGVNDVLCKIIGLKNVSVFEDGLLRVGETDEISPEEFKNKIVAGLNMPKAEIQWQKGVGSIKRVAVCSGADGGYSQRLRATNIDAYLTGEMSYHDWPFDDSKTIVAAGHHYTEIHSSQLLADIIKEKFKDIEVMVAKETNPFISL